MVRVTVKRKRRVRARWTNRFCRVRLGVMSSPELVYFNLLSAWLVERRIGPWDEFYMAPSATTINENGKHWQYAVPRRVVQRSSTLLVLESPRMSLTRDALWHNGL
jgi:hypothetical protein